MAGGGVLNDYSPNAQNGHYVAATVDHLLGAAGLVTGDAAITWDKTVNMPSTNNVFGGGSWTGVPGWLLNPPVGVPLFMVQNAGDMYVRGWFRVPSGIAIPGDTMGGRILRTTSQRYNGAGGAFAGGNGFELQPFLATTGAFTFTLSRDPWNQCRNVSSNSELATSAPTTITPGTHQAVASYEQATRLVSFYLDGALFSQVQPNPGDSDFFAGNPGGQPFGHVPGAADGTTTFLECNISGFDMGAFAVNTFGGFPLHTNWNADVYDEVDFGNHTLSAANVAAAYAARGSFAAYTAAVLAQSPFGAYHLDEYPYTPPPAGWHVGAIGWGS